MFDSGRENRRRRASWTHGEMIGVFHVLALPIQKQINNKKYVCIAA